MKPKHGRASKTGQVLGRKNPHGSPPREVLSFFMGGEKSDPPISSKSSAQAGK